MKRRHFLAAGSAFGLVGITTANLKQNKNLIGEVSIRQVVEASANQTRPVGPSSGKDARLKSSIIDLFERAQAFGFSGTVLVSRGKEVLVRSAFGYADRKQGVLNTPETVFNLASLDKQFIAAAVLRLQELGKLHTTDTLKKFFDFVPEEKSAISVHQLLSHTAGLKNDYWDEHPAMDKPAFVRFVIKDQALQSAPGKQWLYSNSGFVVLEEIIARASGKPYETFLQEALFAPAAMTSTGNQSRKWDSRKLAKYQLWTVDLPKAPWGDPTELLARPQPRWVLMSTVGDLFKWFLALNSNTVLTAESRRSLFTPYMADYGYGWNVVRTPRGTTLVHHGGSDSSSGMLATFRWFVDENIFVCVLSNTMNASLAADYFMNDLEAVIFGGVTYLPPAPTVPQSVPGAAILGKYAFSGGGEFEIRQATDSRMAIVTRNRRAMSLLRFPDAYATSDSVPQDKIAAEIILAATAGDAEPLRKVLAKEQSFDNLKFNFASAKQRLGELRNIRTIHQKWFMRNGVPEVQSFLRLEYEKGEVIRRVRHEVSGQMTFDSVTVPEGIESILAPTEDNHYAIWDFTLGTSARIVFDLQSKPAQLTLRGQHGSVIATKQE